MTVGYDLRKMDTAIGEIVFSALGKARGLHIVFVAKMKEWQEHSCSAMIHITAKSYNTVTRLLALSFIGNAITQLLALPGRLRPHRDPRRR